LALAIAGGVLWTHVWETGGDKRLPWQNVTAQVHGHALWPKAVTRSFWRQRQVDRFLARIFPRGAPEFPRVDYTRRRLVLVAAGPRSSTGYRVEILRATEHRGAIRIAAREVTPALGRRVVAKLTSPFELITIPATAKRVYVQWQGRP
jgi:hypothetical protein